MIVLLGRIIKATGEEPIENGAVVINGNTIEYAGDKTGARYPEGTTVIPIGNGTVLPGFIDQHLHFGIGAVDLTKAYMRDDIQKAMLAVKEMKILLNAGFTSVRECGGLSTSFQEPLNEGWVRGPRIISAGQFIVQTGGHADFIQKFPVEFTKLRISHTRIADGVSECRKAAREQFRKGAKFLKIMTSGGITSQGDGNRESQFSREEIRVFVEEAELHDTYVSSHAQGTAGIKNALICGVRSIEHGMFMDDECIELMLKNNAWLIPTFTIVDSYLKNTDKLPPWVVEKLMASRVEHRLSAKRCYEAGVKIGFGSDLTNDAVICPFGINGREFRLLTEIGMTPMEAIIAGTKTGAEIINMGDRLGTLQEGKIADVVVCSGNPIDDISILEHPENIVLVIKDGKVEKNTLKEMADDS